MDLREAILLILAPLKRGQGTRHLSVGDTGMGKTTLTKLIMKLALELRYAELLLHHDEKDPYEQQFEGTPRIDVEDLKRRPPVPPESFASIVFRGVALSHRHDGSCEPDSVARMGWDIVSAAAKAQSRTRIILNFDELNDCLIPNSQLWAGTYIGSAYRKGRSVGISVFSGIQQPQLVPREAFGLAESMALFRMDGREARYLQERKVISDADANRLPTLQTGEFLLSVKGTRTGNQESPLVIIESIHSGKQTQVLPSDTSERSDVPSLSDSGSVRVESPRGDSGRVPIEGREERRESGGAGHQEGDRPPDNGA